MPSENAYTADATIDQTAEWIAAGIVDGVYPGGITAEVNVRSRAVVALLRRSAGVVVIPHEGRCNDMDRRVK